MKNRHFLSWAFPALFLALSATALAQQPAAGTGPAANAPASPLPDSNLPAQPSPGPANPETAAGKASDPPRTSDTPSVLIDLADPGKEIVIGKPFYVEITVTARPGTQINLPARVDPGPRFQLEGDPEEVAALTFDSGNLLRKYRLKLVTWTTDRLLDRRMERVRARAQRHEQDVAEQKTKLTEARLANQDTKGIEELIQKFEAKLETDRQEMASIEKETELAPIPVTYRMPDGRQGVVYTHEPGKGPRILVSSRLANEPDPKLKEPQSEENVKAGGPFWEPFRLYEENTTLKNIVFGILIGLAVMAVLVPLFLWLRRRLRKPAPPPPPRPAHVVAFERLEALRARGIPEDLEGTQAFAFELSEIVREYFGNRYHFFSLELTTTELLEQLRAINPQGLTLSEIEEFFETLDMVKFAKAPLKPDEASARLETGVDFVRKTLSVAFDAPAGETAGSALPGETKSDPQPAPPPDAAPHSEDLDAMHRRLLLDSVSTKEPGEKKSEDKKTPMSGETASETSEGGNHETT